MSDVTGRRAYIAELLGTFGMVLLGTGAATLDGLGDRFGAIDAGLWKKDDALLPKNRFPGWEIEQ